MEMVGTHKPANVGWQVRKSLNGEACQARAVGNGDRPGEIPAVFIVLPFEAHLHTCDSKGQMRCSQDDLAVHFATRTGRFGLQQCVEVLHTFTKERGPAAAGL